MSSPDGGDRPVFYDPDRRRWFWIVRIGLAAALLAVIAGAGFVVSVLALPLLPHNALPRTRELAEAGNRDPVVADRLAAKRRFEMAREVARLKRTVESDRRRKELAHLAVSKRVAVERAHRLAHPGPHDGYADVVAGFYVNWEETSRASLRRNVGHLTHFLPEWLHVTPDGGGLADTRDVEDRNDVEPFVRLHGLPIIPVINNYLNRTWSDDSGAWNPQVLHALLTTPGRSAGFIRALKAYVLANRWQGINIDFEQVPAADRDALTLFMRALYAALHPAGLLVTQCTEVDDPAFDLQALAMYADFLIPMVYDQHSPGDTSGPGSIAGIGWTRDVLKRLFDAVPPEKVVLGFGNYAYDWPHGSLDAAPLNYQAAVIQAKESRDPDHPDVGNTTIDPLSLNPHYFYYDDGGERRNVWMMDATTTFDQWHEAQQYQPLGVAMWYLGSEDPSVWSVIGREALDKDVGPQVDAGALDAITYGSDAQVDFEGDGELLELIGQPSDGERTVRRNPRTGLIDHASYAQYPSAYVVRRYGYKAKKIALTFDDGPDPTYTPRVLDILRREGVKATFFVIGQQAEEHPDILAREWDDGHEIGNHSYTHPNLARTSDERTLLEISSTQRIIEAVTGHTTTLFRPPYAIDVEPRTADDLRPIMLASRYGFISVGEQIDPQDWNLVAHGPDGLPVHRTDTDIVQNVWDTRDSGSVLLLHDGGGNRDATLRALPQIIERLRAAGYEFVSIADLRGEPRSVMFPSVAGTEIALVDADRWVFESAYLVQRILVTLFTLSIVLGLSRQLLVAILALIQRRRELRRDASLPIVAGAHAPLVSVIIAAYNEEKVIERTVRTILGSDYPAIEVLVVDDGSPDRTSEVVDAAFADEPRVACIRKENGGKASALNRGLAAARGEIIIGLDADTLFRSDTITRLARHFADSRVGAVAGNVRVGNPRNLLTKWQSLEYITSQNFDRRAYELLNCITVVPGAIGAWRKSAVEQVGGYALNTLAEDTDLTWKVRRAGWRIRNDSTALAYTEAPETLRSLARQRYRWAFGTLQDLWKHRDAMFRHGAFGWFALPSLWLYQILFPGISPIMDLVVVWSLIAGNFSHVIGYYVLIMAADLAGAALALWMDHGDWLLLPWLLLQRVVYRQLMYYVILKSLWSALIGGIVGWNKLERRGTARVGG